MLEDHPLAAIFPLMEGAEFDALAASVKARGLVNPITLYEDKILDGRNRYRACVAAGVEVTATMVDELTDGDDPLAFILDQNLDRRHLNETQRAMVADAVAQLPVGANQFMGGCANLRTLSQPEAAQRMRVSRRSVQYARKVRTNGTDAWVKAAERGKVAISRAAEIAELPAEVQDELAAMPEAVLVETHDRIKRDARRRKVFDSIESEALPEGRWSVIYADPPWRFEPFSRETGLRRSADVHYPTMELDDIKALPVEEIAADDAVLWLWATVPMLTQALEVMGAWGFTYKSHVVWVKDQLSTGYWVRNRHELLLIGTRGDFPAPAPEDRPHSVIEGPVTEHSVKPRIFAGLIDKLYPGLSKVELFHQGEPRPGWSQWGHDVQADGEATAS